MKYIVMLLILFISCKENKTDHSKDTGGNEPKIEEIKEIPTFTSEFQKLPLKNLPIMESTSFDSFIEAEDIKNINPEAFSLPLVYKNWYVKGDNFKAISGYRVTFSNEFYSAVLTVIKGEHEMETTLINYDLNGKVIDSKIIAYDEIAEGFFRTTSKLEKDKIIIKNSEWTDKGHEWTDVYKVNVNEDGKIAIMTNEESIISKSINFLGLNKVKVKTDLIVQKIISETNETIVVIPEIVEEGEEYFELNTHIAIFNSQSGEVTHTYFESSKTNNWVSDAIRLDGISIDTKSYLVKENANAFGVRIDYYGSSRVNPFYKQTLSLFVKENDRLINMLHNYSLEENTGEWNGACEGEFHSEKTEFIFTTDKTNAYFDIIVKKTLTKTTNFETEIGDCDYNEEITRETSVLKFDGNQYQ